MTVPTPTDEPNPYQAPAVEPVPPPGPLPTKGANSAAAMAARMIHLRDRGGYSLGIFLRWNARRYLVSIVLMTALLVFFGAVQLWDLCLLVLGLYAGTFLRDLQWFHAVKQGWPLTVQVTNWDKVQAFADGEDPP